MTISGGSRAAEGRDRPHGQGRRGARRGGQASVARRPRPATPPSSWSTRPRSSSPTTRDKLPADAHGDGRRGARRPQGRRSSRRLRRDADDIKAKIDDARRRSPGAGRGDVRRERGRAEGAGPAAARRRCHADAAGRRRRGDDDVVDAEIVDDDETEDDRSDRADAHDRGEPVDEHARRTAADEPAGADDASAAESATTGAEVDAGRRRRPTPPAAATVAPTAEPAPAPSAERRRRTAGDVAPASTRLAAERLADLQRLQAEYVNYKRRVERDRDVARDAGGRRASLEALLPVLDDIHAGPPARRPRGRAVRGDRRQARGDPGQVRARAASASRARRSTRRVHEALMHVEAELGRGRRRRPPSSRCCSPGYRIGDRVLRAARVAVADPP